jgi:hypothetical protein
MRLYSSNTASLREDTTKNRIATKLADAFFHEFRFQPGPSEVNSCRNSLRAVSQVFQEGELLNNGVILEFQRPRRPATSGASLHYIPAGSSHSSFGPQGPAVKVPVNPAHAGVAVEHCHVPATFPFG